MKTSIYKCKRIFDNLLLERKFTFIFCLVLIITTAGSFLGIQIIRDSGNKMLYESMEGSMSYSSSNISDKLSNIENLSEIMLADSTIQSMLSIATDADSSDVAKTDAYRTLSFTVPNYYHNFKQNGISYINLYNTNYISYSDISKCKNLPDSIINKLLNTAHTKPGYPVWNTDYCNEYGLFLLRDVRRAKDLQLDTIGTILVNINLETVIKDSTNGIWSNGTPLYIIYQDDLEIYHSPSISTDSLEGLNSDIKQPYGVIKLDKSSFFYARGTISCLDLDYICLTPYDDITNAQHLYMLISIGIVIFTFIISLALSKFMIKSIMIHFKDLLIKMDNFGHDETVLPVSRYNYSLRHDEIGQLHQGFDHMAYQVQELIQKNYVNEILTKEAELKSLENQINPHFLYNTLESINWHAKSIGADQISTMVESLGALLRITLKHANTLSTLKNELDIVVSYMSIIKIRFDERIQYDLSVPEELYELELPKLTLQPIVENAINYALEEMTETCFIHLTGQLKNETAIIKISNNGSQFPENLLEKLEQNEISPRGFGIGLLNINKRLQLQFGASYGIQIINNELEDLAIVQITIPVKNKKTRDYYDKVTNS